jgi:hypothetical protein
MRAQVQQGVLHALMYQRARAAVRPQPLNLVGNPHHAAPPRLNIYELGPLANVRQRVFLTAVIGRLAAVQLGHLVKQFEESPAGAMRSEACNDLFGRHTTLMQRVRLVFALVVGVRQYGMFVIFDMFAKQPLLDCRPQCRVFRVHAGPGHLLFVCRAHELRISPFFEMR